MSKVNVIVLNNGKKLEFDTNDWFFIIVGDNNGAPQYVKLTNRTNEALQQLISWNSVDRIWRNITKRRQNRGAKTNNNDVSEPEINTNTISNNVLNDIRDQLIEDSPSKGKEAS